MYLRTIVVTVISVAIACGKLLFPHMEQRLSRIKTQWRTAVTAAGKPFLTGAPKRIFCGHTRAPIFLRCSLDGLYRAYTVVVQVFRAGEKSYSKESEFTVWEPCTSCVKRQLSAEFVDKL